MQLQQLFDRLQIAQDRVEVATILVDLATRAERNTALQNVLRNIKLPSPYDVLEYTRPSSRGKKGYWGRIPSWRQYPSIAQAQARLTFSEINFSLFGTKGTVERPDGTRIGLVNHLVGEFMRSRRIVNEEEKVDRQRQKAMDRIVEAVAPTCP